LIRFFAYAEGDDEHFGYVMKTLDGLGASNLDWNRLLSVKKRLSMRGDLRFGVFVGIGRRQKESCLSTEFENIKFFLRGKLRCYQSTRHGELFFCSARFCSRSKVFMNRQRHRETRPGLAVTADYVGVSHSEFVYNLSFYARRTIINIPCSSEYQLPLITLRERLLSVGQVFSGRKTNTREHRASHGAEFVL
jgi:hypothetical protein